MRDYTDQQRKALHAWCRMCEKTLNKAGLFRHGVIDYRKTYRWLEGDFKHYIYKPFLKSYKGKESTEDQNTCDPSEIYLALSSHFIQEYGIQLPEFPSYR